MADTECILTGSIRNESREQICAEQNAAEDMRLLQVAWTLAIVLPGDPGEETHPGEDTGQKIIAHWL